MARSFMGREMGGNHDEWQAPMRRWESECETQADRAILDARAALSDRAFGAAAHRAKDGDGATLAFLLSQPPEN